MYDTLYGFNISDLYCRFISALTLITSFFHNTYEKNIFNAKKTTVSTHCTKYLPAIIQFISFSWIEEVTQPEMEEIKFSCNTAAITLCQVFSYVHTYRWTLWNVNPHTHCLEGHDHDLNIYSTNIDWDLYEWIDVVRAQSFRSICNAIFVSYGEDGKEV